MLKLPPIDLMVRKKTDLEEEGPMSPATRLFHQPNFNCFIVVMLGAGKKIDVDIVAAGLEASIVHHPRFSSLQLFNQKGRTTTSTPKWVKASVVVRDHFVVPDLPDDAPDPDRLVEDYISQLSTTTLDFSKPLWDLHILNIRTSEAEAVAVLRCHHSLGDGLSLMSFLLACFRTTSDPTALPTIPTKSRNHHQKKNTTTTSVGARFGTMLVASVVGLLTMVGVLWNTMVDVFWFTATVLGLKDTETPIKGREGVELNKKRFVHRTLLLDDIGCVKSAMKATVNDVLLGITTAGLTRYLRRRYRDGNQNLPGKIRLRSLVLVNQRKTPEIRALAEMMEGGEMSRKKMKENVQFGNRIGYVILPLEIVERDNPLDYVKRATAVANRKKSSWEALFTFISARLAVKLLGPKIASFISHKALSNTTLSFSNIVGPVEEVGFSGHPLAYIAPSVYGHPHALTLHFNSYMGMVKMVIATDETIIPDPHHLCTDLAGCLIDMKNAAIKMSDKEASAQGI